MTISISLSPIRHDGPARDIAGSRADASDFNARFGGLAPIATLPDGSMIAIALRQQPGQAQSGPGLGMLVGQGVPLPGQAAQAAVSPGMPIQTSPNGGGPLVPSQMPAQAHHPFQQQPQQRPQIIQRQPQGPIEAGQPQPPPLFLQPQTQPVLVETQPQTTPADPRPMPLPLGPLVASQMRERRSLVEEMQMMPPRAQDVLTEAGERARSTGTYVPQGGASNSFESLSAQVHNMMKDAVSRHLAGLQNPREAMMQGMNSGYGSPPEGPVAPPAGQVGPDAPENAGAGSPVVAGLPREPLKDGISGVNAALARAVQQAQQSNPVRETMDAEFRETRQRRNFGNVLLGTLEEDKPKLGLSPDVREKLLEALAAGDDPIEAEAQLKLIDDADRLIREGYEKFVGEYAVSLAEPEIVAPSAESEPDGDGETAVPDEAEGKVASA